MHQIAAYRIDGTPRCHQGWSGGSGLLYPEQLNGGPVPNADRASGDVHLGREDEAPKERLVPSEG